MIKLYTLALQPSIQLLMLSDKNLKELVKKVNEQINMCTLCMSYYS